jgi:hypothetical protein
MLSIPHHQVRKDYFEKKVWSPCNPDLLEEKDNTCRYLRGENFLSGKICATSKMGAYL